MRVQVIATVASLAFVLGGCGQSSSPTAAGSEARWTEAQVDRLAGLQRNPDQTYRLAAHPACVAGNLLRSGAEVQTYKDAGDVVATNPDKSVGVKISGQSPACQRLFASAMARVH